MLAVAVVLALVASLGLAPALAAGHSADAPAVHRGASFYLGEGPSGGTAATAFTYGRSGDVPLLCDWSGDGTASPAVVRGSQWHVRDVQSGGAADSVFHYGRADDTPICGDWNGDGTETPGIVRVSGNNLEFHLRGALAGGPADRVIRYGRVGDVPVTGDWSGDGRHTIGVVRGAQWLLRDRLAGGTADRAFTFGRSGDVPVVGDWDGSGTMTPGVVRGATWHVRDRVGGGAADRTFTFGRVGDTPFVRYPTAPTAHGPAPAPDPEPDPDPEPGSISGEVTSADSGRAIPDATVSVGGDDVTTDADGAFTFSDLDPDDHEVEVSADGFAPAVLSVTVGSDEDVEVAIALDLAAGHVINLGSGEVFTSFGEAITATDMEPGDTLRGHGSFDEDVEVEVAHATLESGPYSASINGQGAESVVRVVGDGVTIDGVTITGFAPDTDDATIVGIEVAADDLTVTGTTVTDISNTDEEMGVGLFVGAHDLVTGLTVTDSTFVAIGSATPETAFGVGVYLSDIGDSTATDVVIDGNTFVGLGSMPGQPGTGVLVEVVADTGASEVAIVDNDFSALGGIGFDLRALDHADHDPVVTVVGDADNVSDDPDEMVAIGLRDSRSAGSDDLSALGNGGHLFCYRDSSELEQVGYYLNEEAAEDVCGEDHVRTATQTVYAWPWDFLVLDSGTTDNLSGLTRLGAQFGIAGGADRVHLTTDGGATWSAAGVPLGDHGASMEFLRGTGFVDTDTGWAVGQWGTILFTDDGGATWSHQDGEATGTLDTVFPRDEDDVWVAGDGMLQHTTDGGATWEEVEPGDLDSVGFRDLVIVGDLLWAVGSGGTIYHADLDEDTWTSQDSGVDVTLNGVTFVDASTGWAVGWDGTIIHTVDGGETWTEQVSGTTSNLWDVDVLDADHGYVVGLDGAILVTTDGGATWTSQSSAAVTALWDVVIVDADDVWAVGNGGMAVRLNR